MLLGDAISVFLKQDLSALVTVPSNLTRHFFQVREHK